MIMAQLLQYGSTRESVLRQFDQILFRRMSAIRSAPGRDAKPERLRFSGL